MADVKKLTIPNAFHKSMVNFDYGNYDESKIDLFSRTCIEELDERLSERHGYRIGQVFEPYVLQELAKIESCQFERIENLDYGSSDTLNKIKKELVSFNKLATISKINLIAALVSLSRFSLANKYIKIINRENTENRDLFELYFIQFIIANRCFSKIEMQQSVSNLQIAIKNRGVPDDRILSAATLIVVWYIKAKIVSSECFEWFVRLGNEIVENSKELDAGALSGWFRGVAMVPAARGHRG